MMFEGTELNLADFNDFKKHPWIIGVFRDYEDREKIKAQYAVKRLVKNLEQFNEDYADSKGRVALVSLGGRIKNSESLLHKLHDQCCADASSGINQDKIQEIYKNIKDKGGVRFAVPYIDEVKPLVNDGIRPFLRDKGYAVDLEEKYGSNYADKDLLERGDNRGYRAYHFYIEVPTVIDIFGTTRLIICEIQARTELQHVWAVKSHDLLYKNEDAMWDYRDELNDDMKNISDSLKTADYALYRIRQMIGRLESDG